MLMLLVEDRGASVSDYEFIGGESMLMLWIGGRGTNDDDCGLG